MSKKPLHKLGTEINTGNSDSILASILQKLFIDLNIDHNTFHRLLERYILRSGLSRNMKEVSNIRGSLYRELMSTSITWKVFLKGISFLNVPKMHISIKLYHPVGTVTVHEKWVYLNPDGSVKDHSDIEINETDKENGN